MNLFRPLLITITATMTTWLFWSLPIPTPPSAPYDIVDWWTEHGTPTATVALVRLVVTTAALWVAIVGTLATLGAVLRIRIPKVVFRGLPIGLRRSLIGAAMAGIVASPVAATTADSYPAGFVVESIGTDMTPLTHGSAGEKFMLVDIGPTSDGFVLSELTSRGFESAATADIAPEDDKRFDATSRESPIAATTPEPTATTDTFRTWTPEPDTEQVPSVPTADTQRIWTPEPDTDHVPSAPTVDTQGTWTVQPGDHLWHIATETLRDSETDQPDPAEVGRYWLKLIDENRSLFDDPDLIHPGTRIILPSLS